jgi:hypothetical protein
MFPAIPYIGCRQQFNAPNKGETMLRRDTKELSRNTLKGRCITQGDQDNDDALKVWNAMIDRSSAVIIRPASPGGRN